MEGLTTFVKEDLTAVIGVQKLPSPMEDELKDDEIVVRVEAAPINPIDFAIILPAGSDPKAFSKAVEKENAIQYPLDKKFKKVLAPRINKPRRSGGEGAGVVVKAGKSKQAQALMDKVVALAGVEGTYSQFVKTKCTEVIPHMDGVTPEEAASSFINPVTVACIVDNVKAEGHKAFIHTAAASQLGTMLVKFCAEEKLPIINIVRKESQEKTLRDLGAEYVVRSDKETFVVDLLEAVIKTEATCLFDAIGGGDLIDTVMGVMEEAAKKRQPVDPLSIYGTSIVKQCYIYGGLNSAPTTIGRRYGFSWGVSAWIMIRYLQKLSPERKMEIFQTVAKDIKTTFKTNYFKKISLKEFAQLGNFLDFLKMETGKKYLVLPQK